MKSFQCTAIVLYALLLFQVLAGQLSFYSQCCSNYVAWMVEMAILLHADNIELLKRIHRGLHIIEHPSI